MHCIIQTTIKLPRSTYHMSKNGNRMCIAKNSYYAFICVVNVITDNYSSLNLNIIRCIISINTV